MPSRNEYVDSLKWRLQDVKTEILDLQKRIQDLFKSVEIKQEQAKYLVILLNAEGVDIVDPELASFADISISETAHDFLSSQVTKSAMHYEDIANSIMAQGVLIPGKNPASNLLAHINRDDRFVRTAPGTYGLREWGIKEMPSRKRKPTRKR
jgi:hypothetical protein